MTEKEAKRHLKRMLESFTAGSILHMLADIFCKSAEKALHAKDEAAYERFKNVENTLFVLGIGVDAACPKGD